jgi:hypothetical protein
VTAAATTTDALLCGNDVGTPSQIVEEVSQPELTASP